jgi:hypothetical protein
MISNLSESNLKWVEEKGIKLLSNGIKPYFKKNYLHQLGLKSYESVLMNLRLTVSLQLFSSEKVDRKTCALQFILKEFKNVQALRQLGLPQSINFIICYIFFRHSSTCFILQSHFSTLRKR